ncbi:hypothetical protein AgCh_027089 [Apium graveolens]
MCKHYDALNDKKKTVGDKGKAKKTENAPTFLKEVNAPIFKSSNTEEKLMDKQSPKTPVKETKNEDARKKKKNRNGKIGINKSNNFAYVADAPRKKCGKYGSVNHLTHLCKKAVSKPTEGACKYNIANANDPYSFCDKFDCISCNLKGKVKKVIWIIDSGYSRHMSGDKALLSQFEEKVDPLVTFGDNNRGFTMGYGKIVSENVVIDDVALVAGLEASEEQSKLWHKKISHLNFKAINTLVKKELIRDMPKPEFAQVEVCEACQKGKMKRSSHKSKTMNSIKFRHATLSEFCKGKDIVQEFSTARTLQKNGVVERKNRTLVEAVRTMLQDANLPTSFWEEAVNTACYTQNKYLINKAHGKSPYSIMSKRKPTVKHLHVFGSKCYILKDNSEYVGKFDSKVFEAIFLGYSLERTTYKVYVIDQKKIMEITDVTFDDDKCSGLECLDDNEVETLAFENLNIDSDSDGEDEVNAQQIMNEETNQQENHENGSSSQTPEFDSTNSGEKEKKNLTVIPTMKKMMKAQVNKLIRESGIEVTLEKQLLVILLLE